MKVGYLPKFFTWILTLIRRYIILIIDNLKMYIPYAKIQKNDGYSYFLNDWWCAIVCTLLYNNSGEISWILNLHNKLWAKRKFCEARATISISTLLLIL